MDGCGCKACDGDGCIGVNGRYPKQRTTNYSQDYWERSLIGAVRRVVGQAAIEGRAPT